MWVADVQDCCYKKAATGTGSLLWLTVTPRPAVKLIPQLHAKLTALPADAATVAELVEALFDAIR